jgi:hypothetical protein
MASGTFGHQLARLQQHQDASVGLPPIKIVRFDFTLSPSSTRRRIGFSSVTKSGCLSGADTSERSGSACFGFSHFSLMEISLPSGRRTADRRARKASEATRLKPLAFR